jgi:hypothetical protein
VKTKFVNSARASFVGGKRDVRFGGGVAGRLLWTRRRHCGSAIEGEKRTKKEKRGGKSRGSGKEKGGREKRWKRLSLLLENNCTWR